MPVIRQCFFESEDPAADLERQLYLMRKRVESRAISGLYFCSLSSRVLVYKGLLTPLQLRAFYSDLAAPDFTAPFAIFHQRYSTNTSPSWQLAQPFRYVAHNGEINTISANRRWTSAPRKHSSAASSPLTKVSTSSKKASAIPPASTTSLEVFLRQNYNVAAAMLRMVPPAWESDSRTFVKLRSYWKKPPASQEPWDGPAALVFSDGQMVGAKLDRNGLRPMRYVLTSDGLLVVGSEVGLADLRDKQIIERNRLGPGEILLVDSLAGAIFRNNNEVAELLGSDGLRDGLPRRDLHRASKQPSHAAVQATVTHLGPTAIRSASVRDRAAKNSRRHGLDRRPISPAVPASRPRREGSHLEHGRRRASRVPFLRPPRARGITASSVSRKSPIRRSIRCAKSTSCRSTSISAAKIAAESPVLDAGQMADTGKRTRSHTLWSAAASPRLVPRKMGPAVQRIDFTFDAAKGVAAAEAALDRVRDDIAAAAKKNPSLIVLSRSPHQ